MSPAAIATCVARATQHDASARLPLFVDGLEVGAVACAALASLREQAAAVAAPVCLWPAAVHWHGPPGDARDAALDRLHAALRKRGLIRAWRDERYAVVDPVSGTELAVIERAASRFWGTLTFGAHATGYVAGADGRPVALWIARRSAAKATDPGMWDNLVGGGVPRGQSPADALAREAWEEAGLDARGVALPRDAAAVLQLRRDVPEGLQYEWLYAYDLALPEGRVPVNQDGEVAGFERMAPEAAMRCALDGAMTVDAALVTLDFGLRHGLLAGPLAAAAQAALAPLRVQRPR